MKLKSLAMLAVSGVLIASISYVAPAMADDTVNNYGSTMQTPSDNMPNPGNNMMSNSGNNMSSNNALSGSPSDMGMGNSNPSNMDEGTPDTATGDDDY